jgi:hypothetical protein
MQVSLIPQEALPVVVPRVLPMLSRAVSYSGGRYTIGDLREELLDQRRQLWVVFEPEKADLNVVAAFTTQIGEYPQRRVLRVDFLAGESMGDWIMQVQHMLTRYAVDHECSGLEMTGRSGWIGHLEKLGWQTAFVTLEKRFPQEGAKHVQ